LLYDQVKQGCRTVHPWDRGMKMNSMAAANSKKDRNEMFAEIICVENDLPHPGHSLIILLSNKLAGCGEL
jgi:hypothetical protein